MESLYKLNESLRQFTELFKELHEVVIRQNDRIKMLEDECRALREQLCESNPDTFGYGIAAIKPNKKAKK